MDKRRIFSVLLKLGLTGVVIGLLLNFVGWDKVIGGVKQADPIWLMAFFGIALVGRCIEAIQMRLVLTKLEVKITILRIFQANALSVLYSLVVPGDVVASVAKWSNLSAATGKKTLILSAMVYNRIALLTPVLAVGTVALVIENPFTESTYIVVGVMLTSILIMLLALGLFHPTLSVFGSSVLRWLCKPFPPRIREMVEYVIVSLEGFRRFGVRDHLAVYGLSLLVSFTSVTILGCATRAMGIELSPLVLFWVLAILTVARQIPATVGNLGVREGLLIMLMGLYGVEPERALAVGLILFSSILVYALFGLVYQVTLSLGLASWRSQVGCEPGR